MYLFIHTNYYLFILLLGSGSGKTTLLNLIANRIPQESLNKLNDKNQVSDAKYVGSGSILYNEKVITPTNIRNMIGYGKLCYMKYEFLYYYLK